MSGTNISKDHNILIYMDELKRFVFNYWKCSNQKGSQAFNIIDAKIQNALSLYLNDDQYTDPNLETYTVPNGKQYKYLLYHYKTKKPILTDRGICTQMEKYERDGTFRFPYTVLDTLLQRGAWKIYRTVCSRTSLKIWETV